VDQFLKAALDEARLGLQEGGIPIGSVLVSNGRILGRGHNRRVQQGSVVLHAEMDALERAGRQPARVYRECTLYTTLSPCAMCSGAILLYGIPQVVIGENRTFQGLALDDNLKSRDAEAHCGLGVIDLRSGDLVHWLWLKGVVQELYDVVTLSGVQRPSALGFKTDEIRRTLRIGKSGEGEN